MNGWLQWDGGRLDPALWQGIRYLEVDTTQPGFAAVVVAHLARPVNDIVPGSIQVTGGRSIRNLPFNVIINNGDSFFVVEIASEHKGDHSDYYVQLSDGGADPLHPFFSRAAFNFYIECETGDCRPPQLLPTKVPGKYPPLDLRNKDFRGFMGILTEWVRVNNPHLADLSTASTERMLLELLAHHGDFLSYYQDRVANEAFLDTASQRYSVRQHGVLLGYSLDDGNAATTILAFDVTNPGYVPAGLEIQTLGYSAEIPVVFHTTARTRVEPDNNSSNLAPAAWPGAFTASIPAGATSLLLWDQTTSLQAGMRIAFSQGVSTNTVTLASVRNVSLPGWVQDPGDPENNVAQPLTEVTWSPPLERAFQPWSDSSFRIYGNIADARHGRLHRAWINPSFSPPRTEVVIELNRRNSVIVPLQRLTGPPIPLLRAVQAPEGPILFTESASGRATPMLDVTIDGVAWANVDHLHSSQSYDTHYVATADENGQVWIQFGDGIRGREVRVAANGLTTELEIEIRFRTGEATQGNCARDALSAVILPAAGTAERDAVDQLGAIAVTNVEEGRFGSSPESIDAARLAIPASLRSGPLHRAVSLSDYAEAARTVPNVARAVAKALNGVFNTVMILVDPVGQTELPEPLRQAVFAAVDGLRMAGREHVVAAAVYVPLQVEIAICVEPGFLRHEVRDRVYAELRPGADNRPGYFHPDRLNFGDPIELGELLAFVQRIAGVRSVKALSFRRQRDLTGPAVVDRMTLATTEIARLDADPDYPENGELRIFVVGLDDVDENDYAIGGPV